MTFRVAVVQPISHSPGEDERHSERGLAMVATPEEILFESDIIYPRPRREAAE